MLTKLEGFTNLISNLADQPTLNAESLKDYFDSSPEELRVALNNLMDELQSVADGSSGADQIGATAITGLTGGTVQLLLESVKALVDSKTTKTGDHEGTWQGLNPVDFDSGQQALDLQALQDQVNDHENDTSIHQTTAEVRSSDVTKLIVEVRTSDPINPEPGRIWFRSDL